MYRIKGWHKFQHFKDRKPPWIKLYRDLLDDVEWHNLDAKAAKALVMLWLIASENDGDLPNVKTLAFRLRVPENEMKSIVSKLSHWLEQVDINAISSRYQDDTLETEIETDKEKEIEREGERKGKPRKTPHRLPEDWQLSEEDRAFAVNEGIDPHREFLIFKNYWLSKGKDDTKLDWSRTWQNWCMKNRNTAPTTAKPRNVPIIDGEVGISEAFPPSGTIRYNNYGDFVRSLGLNLDPDWVADQFRTWAERRNIALDGPDVIRAFKGFARAQKAVS